MEQLKRVNSSRDFTVLPQIKIDNQEFDMSRNNNSEFRIISTGDPDIVSFVLQNDEIVIGESNDVPESQVELSVPSDTVMFKFLLDMARSRKFFKFEAYDPKLNLTIIISRAYVQAPSNFTLSASTPYSMVIKGSKIKVE